VAESLMLSERRNGIDPIGGGSVIVPESVPANEVLVRP
jgi:hypothetical protein